jgi:hypothetical protein
MELFCALKEESVWCLGANNAKKAEDVLPPISRIFANHRTSKKDWNRREQRRRKIVHPISLSSATSCSSSFIFAKIREIRGKNAFSSSDWRDVVLAGTGPVSRCWRN